jgi:hypothetical protein
MAQSYFCEADNLSRSQEISYRLRTQAVRSSVFNKRCFIGFLIIHDKWKYLLFARDVPASLVSVT